MYKKIGDYGIIGNLHSAALIGRDGSIDWLCLPHLDSPSVFGALLDAAKGGRFAVAPAEPFEATVRYLPDTNILETLFRTRTGSARLTDFMPVIDSRGTGRDDRHVLYRLVEWVEGRADLEVEFSPRFDYARARTVLEAAENGIVARGGGRRLDLGSTRPLSVDGDRARGRWVLEAGERVWLRLEDGAGALGPLDPEAASLALWETETFWRNWMRKTETGRTFDPGPYREMVNRSALALKLLYYEPTGTVAAAATTSLPERVGGVRNWDYRFTWIRDASFTLQALHHLGHLSEMEGYLRWIETVLSREEPEVLQVLYGLRGERELPEITLDHLEGYKGSRPVRIGNGAARQNQLDIYGELMDAALRLSDYVGKIDTKIWSSLRTICDHVAERWRDADYGIWEVRGGPRHFVHSKVMCWVALDRGITIARRYGFPADLGKWGGAARAIRADVFERGWSEKKRAFVQHYGTEALDASGLLIPVVGFLPFDDPRVLSTVEAIRRELGEDGFLRRYVSDDGLPGGEGSFLLCTFWLVDNLIAQGSHEEAERILRKAASAANHLGLFAEEHDAATGESLGNIPQAFTHIGFVNSVVSLCRAKAQRAVERGTSLPRRLFGRRIVLNAGDPPGEASAEGIAERLKEAMNVLRGAFFDTPRGRVAYERMAGSDAYREYVALSTLLKKMDPGDLRTRQERLAFWINLYNVIVIHGVVALGIRDSVKEVRNFFRRVQYRVDDLFFSPEDIEHGILRGNRRPPRSLFRRFRGSDPRLRHVVSPVDPRIHFALVCASSSCPPIGVYRAERIENDLDIAARTFLNGGGVSIDRERNRVVLSRIFEWYADDFGRTPAGRIRFIAPYLYDPVDRDFLESRAESVTVAYQDYDWRLNRLPEDV